LGATNVSTPGLPIRRASLRAVNPFRTRTLADGNRMRGRCLMSLLKTGRALAAKVRSNAVDFANGLFKP